jgi:C4-dicarboxylate transporter DctQ subunit
MGGLLIGFSAFMALIEVICRYFFRFTHSWAEELIVYIVIYGVFLVSGPNLKSGYHINVDLLINHLSPQWRRMVEFIGILVGFVVSLFLTYTGANYVVYLKKMGVVSTSSLQAPMYLTVLIFPIGMGLLSFFYFEKLISVLNRFDRTKDPAKSKEENY